MALDVFQEHLERVALDARVAAAPFVEMDDGTPESRCGLLALADTAVAVPFVGTLVASIVVTQMLRHQLGLATPEVVSGDALADLSLTCLVSG